MAAKSGAGSSMTVFMEVGLCMVGEDGASARDGADEVILKTQGH
jgi:hypothetical protein